MVTRYEPDDAGASIPDLMTLLREHHGREIFSEDGSSVDEQVAALLAGRRIATAESCTRRPGRGPADRLTRAHRHMSQGEWWPMRTRPSPSFLGVYVALIDAHGAVSEPVADAMAEGALLRFAADTAVAITGIAGPGGGTDDKPVGTVCFCVKLADGTTDVRTMRMPGSRSDIRERSTTVAMHLLRRALG